MKDSLKVTQNEDGTFNFEWDKDDPKWNWMNELTTEELQSIIETSIRNKLESYDY